MPTSEQLEREAKASRERLSRTIDELKVRLSPASMMDEATAYLRRAADEPIVSDAPPPPAGLSRYALPMVLLGAGLAGLAIEAGRAERERERRERLAEALSEEVALAAAAATAPPIDPTLAAVDDVEPLRRTAEVVETVPSMAERNLTQVETVSIAPAPAREDEREPRLFP
jgi:hypothetical protein